MGKASLVLPAQSESVIGPPLEGRWRGCLSSAVVQVFLLAACHFSSIGMWNALNGIGSLGTDDPDLAHYCNSMMYLMGIIGGLIGGGVVNVIGVRKATIVGLLSQSTTLCAYYLYYFKYRTPVMLKVVVLYNGFTSLGISCFTSAVGTALVHYPTPEERNLFIAISSSILNLGGLVGGIMALAMNFRPTIQETTDATDLRPLYGTSLSSFSYKTIIGVSFVGVALAVFLVQPQQTVRKSDGVPPHLPPQSIKEELVQLPKEFTNKYLYFLMPLFLVNVWHEVVLFNYFNATLFNIRSRAMNSCVYYIARLSAAFIFKHVCEKYSNELKGRINSVVVLINVLLTIGTICSMMVFMNCFNLALNTAMLDFLEPRSMVLIACFLIYGALETIAGCLTFWLLGELDVGTPESRNRMIGLSRALINIGGCISWSADIVGLSAFMQWSINLLMWVLCVAGVLGAAQRAGGEAAQQRRLLWESQDLEYARKHPKDFGAVVEFAHRLKEQAAAPASYLFRSTGNVHNQADREGGGGGGGSTSNPMTPSIKITLSPRGADQSSSMPPTSASPHPVARQQEVNTSLPNVEKV